VLQNLMKLVGMPKKVGGKLCRIQRFARIAVELAGEHDADVTHQLCALVVSKSKVLSIGYNKPKTDPISKDTTMQQLHAEMSAVKRCREGELQGVDVIIARCRPSGKPGLAKPCKICEDILRDRGVRRVFYTINSEDPEHPEIGIMIL